MTTVAMHKYAHMAGRHAHEYGLSMVALADSPHLIPPLGLGAAIFVIAVILLVALEA